MTFIKDAAARARQWLDNIRQRHKEEINNSTTRSMIYICANPDQPVEKRRSRITYPETLVLAVPPGRNYNAFDKVLHEEGRT